MSEKKHRENFNILSHQRNANQDNSEISFYTCKNGQDKNTNDNTCMRGCMVREYSLKLVPVQFSSDTLDFCMVISQKIRKQPPSTLSNKSFRYIPKVFSIIPQ